MKDQGLDMARGRRRGTVMGTGTGTGSGCGCGSSSGSDSGVGSGSSRVRESGYSASRQMQRA